MIPLVAGKGVDAMAAVMGGVLVGGLFHMLLGTFIKKSRYTMPPLVTGLVVLMIGLALIKVGIQYAAGGIPAIGKAEYGSALNWSVAGIVIIVALALGMVSFGNIGQAAVFAVPMPFHFGIEFTAAAIIGMCAMSFVSAVETVGDVSGITRGGAKREATDEEVQGATYADGLGSAIAGLFGALPNTSFSQNVGLVAITGVIVMFGMVAAAGVSILSTVEWNRRKLLIFAISLSVGLGLQLEPGALQHLTGTLKILMTSGLLPAAVIAMVLNIILPQELGEDA